MKRKFSNSVVQQIVEEYLECQYHSAYMRYFPFPATRQVMTASFPTAGVREAIREVFFPLSSALPSVNGKFSVLPRHVHSAGCRFSFKVEKSPFFSRFSAAEASRPEQNTRRMKTCFSRGG